MIKEKELYSFPGHAQKLSARHLVDPQHKVNIQSLKETLETVIRESGLPATIAEDTLSFKTGLLSSGKAPCWVISHMQEPKDFRSMVIAVKEASDGCILTMGWYGQSKVDKQLEKLNKGEARADRQFDKAQGSGDMLDIVSHGAGGLLQGMKNKALMKKIDSRADLEAGYHDGVINTVVTVCCRLQGMLS